MVAQTFLSEPADKNVCATERDKIIEKEYRLTFIDSRLRGNDKKK